uniref:Uncharacterized protein n=1 Tax=Laticauda laticaudata TaxID=8630 RepID=A0A8C5RWW2_LATLA
MSAFSPATIPMEHMLDFSQASHPESQSKNTTSSLPLVDAIRQPSVNTPFLQNVTDDMEQILKKQTEELKANVEIFSECIKQNVFSVQEHLQFLQLLKEQLEQLEHNYIATKEKHYALQLQNHKHSSRTTGKFDPNRKVEGEIFKLGMFLEDIKEKIEKTFASYSSTYISSPSIRSHLSPVCSSYSASPLNTSTNESPKRNIAGLNIPQNENYWKNKNHPIEVTPQKAYKKAIQGHSNHLFHQIHLELQKKNIHLKMMASVDKVRQQTNKHILVLCKIALPIKGFVKKNREKILYTDYVTDRIYIFPKPAIQRCMIALSFHHSTSLIVILMEGSQSVIGEKGKVKT